MIKSYSTFEDVERVIGYLNYGKDLDGIQVVYFPYIIYINNNDKKISIIGRNICC